MCPTTVRLELSFCSAHLRPKTKPNKEHNSPNGDCVVAGNARGAGHTVFRSCLACRVSDRDPVSTTSHRRQLV